MQGYGVELYEKYSSCQNIIRLLIYLLHNIFDKYIIYILYKYYHIKYHICEKYFF